MSQEVVTNSTTQSSSSLQDGPSKLVQEERDKIYRYFADAELYELLGLTKLSDEEKSELMSPIIQSAMTNAISKAITDGKIDSILLARLSVYEATPVVFQQKLLEAVPDLRTYILEATTNLKKQLFIRQINDFRDFVLREQSEQTQEQKDEVDGIAAKLIDAIMDAFEQPESSEIKCKYDDFEEYIKKYKSYKFSYNFI